MAELETPINNPVIAPIEVVQTVPTPEVVTTPAPKTPLQTSVEAPQTVLGEALDKKEITSVVEPVKTEVSPEVPKVEEGGKSDEPAAPPVYDTFIVPEGVSLDNESIGKFTDLLSDLELKGKAHHALVQEFGQKAVDFHITEVQKAQTNLTNLYKQTWERQKIEWRDSFLKDPEIGGNRFQTTVDSALTFIRTHGGTFEQQTEFRNLMETSGLGNHPAVIRLLANAGRAMGEGQPLTAVKPISPPKSKTATLYGKSE